jgi:putative membrane protein
MESVLVADFGLGPMELLFTFFGFFFWVAVIALIVYLVSRRPKTAGKGSGLRLLEERYARGEITRDEFIERREVLKQNL